MRLVIPFPPKNTFFVILLIISYFKRYSNVKKKIPRSKFGAKIFITYAIIENTIANKATDSQRPTTMMYWAKPFPVSPRASEPAAPALP